MELKPCPFCGKKPQLIEPDDSSKLWSVSCLSCVSIDLEELTEERAIQKWNTRHYPADVQQAIERMEPREIVKTNFGTFDLVSCSGCGHVVSINAKFCSECGQRLDWSK